MYDSSAYRTRTRLGPRCLCSLLADSAPRSRPPPHARHVPLRPWERRAGQHVLDPAPVHVLAPVAATLTLARLGVPLAVDALPSLATTCAVLASRNTVRVVAEIVVACRRLLDLQA